MKVCLMSDSHGDTDAMKKVIQRERPDLILHAGDYAADVSFLTSKGTFGHAPFKMVCVAGNCDLPGAAELEQTVSVADIQVFLTHGHRHRVKEGYLNLVYAAQEVQANLVVFGHTHVPAAFVEQGKLFINPGSLSLPRGYRTPTYVILDVGGHANSDESDPVSEFPLNITFKSVEQGALCNDLSIQVVWDPGQHKFSFQKFN